MKASFVALAVLLILALVVLAVVFRSQRARELLRLGRNLLYLWVIVVVALAVVEAWRRGGI